MKPTLLLVALAGLAGCGPATPTSPVRIADAVVTLPALPGRPGAAYFRIESDSGEARIVAITSPKVDRIELHESVADAKGVTRMRKMDQAVAAPGAPLLFEPGGKHAMLFGLDPSLRPGDRLALVIRLEPAATLTTEAQVKGPGAVDHGSH